MRELPPARVRRTDPTNTSFNAFSGADRRGVTCDFCHKVVDVDVSPEGITRRTWWSGSSACRQDHHAPFHHRALARVRPARRRHLPRRPPHARGARHGDGLEQALRRLPEDSGDSRDPNGDFREIYDGPASQLTYTEWATSRYAAEGTQCQDCHMPPTGADHFCSLTGNTRDPSQIHSHVFEGTTPEFLRRAVRLRANSVAKRRSPRREGRRRQRGRRTPRPHRRDAPESQSWSCRRPSGRHAAPQLSGRRSQLGRRRRAGGGRVRRSAGEGLRPRLVDEFLAENVLFTEAVRAFDNRIPAGQTDSRATRSSSRRGSPSRTFRVTSRLYYRRA